MPVSLRATDNVTWINAIREDATASYQARIPVATQGNLDEVLSSLYQHKSHRNEFVDALVNRIGAVIGRSQLWSNPLGEFKSGTISFGDEVEEWATGLLKATTYDPDRNYMEQDVWGQELVPTRSIFHKINRQDKYKFTLNDKMMRRAFLEPGGLNQFVTSMMNAPVNSDAIDEFLLMTHLFPAYEKNGGFYHVHVPDVADMLSTPDDAKYALRKMRAFDRLLTFPSTKYNAAKMPSWINPQDIVLFTTPQYDAAVDVEALAGAFNIDRAKFNSRKISIPPERMGITGAQAILTTKDFFKVFDTLIETTSMPNPVGLYTNFWLHHHQIISASLFTPAILFTTGPDDEEIALTFFKPTGITVTADDPSITTLYPSGIYQFNAAVTTSPAGGENLIGVVWGVTGNNDPFTYVTRDGVLHVGAHETATTLNITAMTVADNPDALRDNPQSTSTATASIDQSTTVQWPIAGVLAGITVMGVQVASVSPSTTSYNVTVPALPTTSNDVQVYTYGGADVSISVNKSTGVVTIVLDSSTTAAPVTYTVTPTVG